jgi:hypothetical protein
MAIVNHVIQALARTSVAEYAVSGNKKQSPQAMSITARDTELPKFTIAASRSFVAVVKIRYISEQLSGGNDQSCRRDMQRNRGAELTDR